MADIKSSRRLQLDRAPRLRRIAELVDEQAPQAADPAKARMVARGMRLRAAELEMGVDRVGYDQEDVDPAIEAIAFDTD